MRRVEAVSLARAIKRLPGQVAMVERLARHPKKPPAPSAMRFKLGGNQVAILGLLFELGPWPTSGWKWPLHSIPETAMVMDSLVRIGLAWHTPPAADAPRRDRGSYHCTPAGARFLAEAVDVKG